jgi:hypothetical protein
VKDLLHTLQNNFVSSSGTYFNHVYSIIHSLLILHILLNFLEAMSALLSQSLMSLHTENQAQYLLVLNFARSLLINFQVLLTAFPFKREKNVIIVNNGSF